MKKIILYLFLVTFISCDHYEKINNRFHELLTDYVFHDDVYMTERAPITISKSYENYYIVVSGEHKDEVLGLLMEKGFTILSEPQRYYYGTSAETVLPSKLQNSFELYVKGNGNITDIPNLIYCESLYYEETSSQLVYNSCSIAIDIKTEQENAFIELSKALNVILIGPWMHQEGERTYIAICTTESIANCVKIYNCLFEIGGYSDMYIIQPDNIQPALL